MHAGFALADGGGGQVTVCLLLQVWDLNFSNFFFFFSYVRQPEMMKNFVDLAFAP